MALGSPEVCLSEALTGAPRECLAHGRQRLWKVVREVVELCVNAIGEWNVTNLLVASYQTITSGCQIRAAWMIHVQEADIPDLSIEGDGFVNINRVFGKRTNDTTDTMKVERDAM